MRLLLTLLLLWLATRYFTARQTLCMCYSYRRWRLVKGDWLLMDQDLRDIAISKSTDITILCSARTPITINIQSNWPLQFVRHEILLLCNDVEESFYFKLDGCKVRTRNETKIKCGDCASPHVLELVP